MPVVDVPWPTSSNPGGAPGEGSGRVINCYAFSDAGAPRWKPLPGLIDFALTPVEPLRGWLVSLGLVFAVVGHNVYQIDSGGGVTQLEEQVAGDGLVTMARNNASPPVLTITSSNGSYVIDPNGVVKSFPDPNLPPVNSVTFLDGYFLWTTSAGAIWASGLNASTVNALSFARAEAKPDGLLRGVVFGQQFFAMGQETIEVWNDVGALPFPLTRSEVIPIGLIGQWAVAGYEDGWAGPLIFVAQDGSVRRLDGYTPTRISSEDLEQLISRVADTRTLVASVYTFGGNAIWSLSSPTWTWEFNTVTGQWHERESFSQGRSLGRWRGARTLNAFGRWLVADEAGGKVSALSSDVASEGADPLIWGMDSGPAKQFPVRIRINAAFFDFVLGKSDLAIAPKAMLSWSHDGGGLWLGPVERSLGRQGVYVDRMAVYRLGLSSHAGTRLRFRVSDPIYTSFAGARIDAQGTR